MAPKIKNLVLFFLFILVICSSVFFIPSKKKRIDQKKLSHFIIQNTPWISYWSKRFETISTNENGIWPKEESALSLNEISSVLQFVQFSDDASFTIRYIAKDEENNIQEIEKKFSFWDFKPFSSGSIQYNKKRKCIFLQHCFQKYALCYDEKSFDDACHHFKTLHKFFTYRVLFGAIKNNQRNVKSLHRKELIECKNYADAYFELPFLKKSLQDKSSFSKIAKKHGSTHLACLLPEKELSKVLLCKNGKRYLISDNLSFFFLTNTENDLKKLLEKTENRLPLYLFKLEGTIDTLPFYVRGQDSKEIKNQFEIIHALEHPELNNRIIFLEPIALKSVQKIYVRKECKKRLLRKLKTYLEDEKTFHHLKKAVKTLKPFDFYGCNDFVYYSHWTEPKSEGSYDRLSYIVQTKELSTDDLVHLFIEEMPRLKTLIDGKLYGNGELVRKDIEKKGKECIEKIQSISFPSSTDISKPKSLFQILYTFQNIASATLLPKEQPNLNHHILLSILERCGFTRKEVHLARHIFEKDFIQNPESIKKEMEFCKKAHLFPHVCYKYQKLYFETLEGLQIEKTKDNELQKYLSEQTLGFQHTLPTKELDTRYIWEFLDPEHRYGNHLYNERIKFEKMLLSNPSSKWRGKFLEWVNAEHKRIPKVSFFSKEEQEDLRLRFENGKITLPKEKLFKPRTTLMFVLSKDGEFYVGYKERGNSLRKSIGHSSLLANKPVTSAGRITFDNEGNVLVIGDSSGHYRPGKFEMFLALHALQNKGIDLSKVILTRGGPRGYGIFFDTIEKNENALSWYKKHKAEYLPILTGKTPA